MWWPALHSIPIFPRRLPEWGQTIRMNPQLQELVRLHSYRFKSCRGHSKW